MFTPLGNFCGFEGEIVILKGVASSVRHRGLSFLIHPASFLSHPQELPSSMLAENPQKKFC